MVASLIYRVNVNLIKLIGVKNAAGINSLIVDMDFAEHYRHLLLLHGVEILADFIKSGNSHWVYC